MIRIAIVEDEDFYVEELRNYLDRYQKEKGEELAVTVYHDGDSITWKYQAQFDIILMDIQMKLVDGMTAAEEIRRMDSEVVIMFITNMTQYAIRGYEVGAFDYVLKPVSYFAFSQKLSRAISRIRKDVQKYITITVRGGILRLNVADIYYVESSGHNLLFHTLDTVHTATGTMKGIEDELKEYSFSRGNKCYLINLAHVDGIKDKCALVKGELLQLSRPKQNAFMQDLTKYWGEKK